MDGDLKSFFTLEQNVDVLLDFSKKVKGLELSNSNFDKILNNLKTIINSFLNNAKFYDESCQFNIKWIGDNGFISYLFNFIESSNSPTQKIENIEENIKSIFVSAYRFICEADFMAKDGLNLELRQIKTFVEENLDLFNSNLKSQLIFANFIMPVEITKQLIHHPNLSYIQLFNERYDSALKLKENWDDELAKKTIEINALKNKLDEYKTGFNFVGLYKGFNSLSTDKLTQKNWALGFLIGLGVLALVPVITEIYLFLFHTILIKSNTNIVLYSIVPMITLQIILVYFFRVALFNFKSINAQLLQIELRKTLCQFIQSYTSYAKEMKESDKTSLDKFENLIFSGLISNEENLPSTFDGLEQIGKIIQSIKSSSS